MSSFLLLLSVSLLWIIRLPCICCIESSIFVNGVFYLVGAPKRLGVYSYYKKNGTYFIYICRSVYHAVTDITILRFMAEVCWGPMLAAFSVTLDQSDDNVATSQCLLGFRHAVHVTAVMGLQTQRDAFVTSMAKFTYLHCAADMKQKNVEAVKVCVFSSLNQKTIFSS